MAMTTGRSRKFERSEKSRNASQIGETPVPNSETPNRKGRWIGWWWPKQKGKIFWSGHRWFVSDANGPAPTLGEAQEVAMVAQEEQL
jgi:hypothetical protein